MDVQSEERGKEVAWNIAPNQLIAYISFCTKYCHVSTLIADFVKNWPGDLQPFLMADLKVKDLRK